MSDQTGEPGEVVTSPDTVPQRLFWDVLSERDDYRSRAGAAVARIENCTVRVVNAQGSTQAIQLPIEEWRSIRAMLQRDHVPYSKRSVPPGSAADQ